MPSWVVTVLSALAVLAGATACAAPPAALVPSGSPSACIPARPPDLPPAPAPSRPTSPPSDPPFEATFGEHVLTVAFESAPRSRYVARVTVDDVIVFPRACCPGDKDALCSKEHRAVREAHGEQLLLLDTASDETRAELFFAAMFFGSPECSAYGYWSMRVDAKGVRISNPIAGCMMGTHRGRPGEEEPSPPIHWGKPSMMRVHEHEKFSVFELDERTYRWRLLRQGGPW
jgi:hypothetical protein